MVDATLSICLQIDPVTGRKQLFGFMQDLTERQRQEAERRRGESLMALGMLASGVAHDFNNMVCGIQGYAQLMTETEDPAKLRSMAQRLGAITVRAQDLTASLLRFARQGGDKPATFSAFDSVRDALSLFRTSPGGLVTTEEELQGEGPVLLGYPSQLQNAVLNLCLNAKDAMGGRADAKLTVRGRTILLDPAKGRAILPRPLVPGPYFHLEVADNGPGMSEEVRAKCLNPFFSTKGDHGTGLGLSSVQGAMSDHRGALHIETAPGEGCRVHLYVPVV